MWGDISSWSWFVFPWWLLTLRNFSCTCWPFVYLLWKNIYSRSRPIFKWDYSGDLLLSCVSFLYIWDVNSLSNIRCANIFSYSIYYKNFFPVEYSWLPCQIWLNSALQWVSTSPQATHPCHHMPCKRLQGALAPPSSRSTPSPIPSGLHDQPQGDPAPPISRPAVVPCPPHQMTQPTAQEAYPTLQWHWSHHMRHDPAANETRGQSDLPKHPL